jgi:hypothetical protein
MSTIDTITITATISIPTCAMLADDSLHVFLHQLQPIQAPQIFRFSPNSQGNFAAAERKCTVGASKPDKLLVKLQL